MLENERYIINIDEIKLDFKFKEPSDGKCCLTHSQGNKLKLLPYAANEKNIVTDFKGVTGAFSRYISDKDLSREFNADNFIEDVVNKVGEFEGENSENTLKEIVKSMFIDNGNLVNFDIKTLNYISSGSADEKIAKFLYSILFDEKIKNTIIDKYDTDVENILYKLVLSALPELKYKKTPINDSMCYLPFIKELFIDDMKFIIKNEELYKESLIKLLKYYYMFYVTQLSLKLSKFEKADVMKADEVYYTLSWESTSKNRTAYNYGWEKLRNSVEVLFTHAITLELLNHSNTSKQLGYVDLFNYIENCDVTLAANEIENVINTYKEQVGDVDWNGCIIPNKDSGNIAFNKVYELYHVVNYQFNNSARSRAHESYKNWFVRYYQENFGKRRGSLGYNLNFTEDDIIFMTKLCIKDNEKLKLKTLFIEFEKRGAFFDRDSKMKIIQLYEKLNLIEKKSDSGDAQYVKSIL